MLKTYVKCLLQVNARLSNRSFSSSNVCLREKWDLISAVCVERKPLITPPLNQLEQEYKKMLSDIEFESSLKSDHEIRHEKELKQMEQLKKGGDNVDVHLKETAQDLVDSATEELAQFKPANRITEDDKTNNVKSLNRQLDKHLVLLVSQTIGKDKFYLLPQGLRQDGESLRQAADRVLKETCGDELKASIYGNAPSSFYKYKYPKNLREENRIIGAKVFIYFARYNKGQLSSKDADYKWLDREDLEKALPQEYQDSVLQMLIDE